jgi:oxaloacetate decarboxylase alpha subunit
MLKGTDYDTGLDITALLDIAAYFRTIRKKYAKFESSFLGADTRILASQVPGGMLSNLENQLKEQGASDKIDQVLKEIAIVQKDCGYIPLVTPTSQIVGTQAVFNVLFGRYEKLTAETADLVTGRYGATPAPTNPDLVKKALVQNKYDAVLECRPADKIANEYAKLAEEAKAAGALSDEDVLTYAMFPKVAPGFFAKRSEGPVSSDSFVVKPAATTVAPVPATNVVPAPAPSVTDSYTVTVNGTPYNVVFGPAGAPVAAAPAAPIAASSAPQTPAATPIAPAPVAPAATGTGVDIIAPVAGTLLKQVVPAGSNVTPGQTVLLIESMKMELEIKATASGPISYAATPGSQIAAGQVLAQIGGGGVTPVVPAPVQVAPAAPAPTPVPVAPAPAPVAAVPSGVGTVIPAPVAGTLLKNSLPEGTAVTSGQTIVLIESMKMELEIKAASNGSVHYLAAPGSQITAGQPLAEIR